MGTDGFFDTFNDPFGTANQIGNGGDGTQTPLFPSEGLFDGGFLDWGASPLTHGVAELLLTDLGRRLMDELLWSCAPSSAWHLSALALPIPRTQLILPLNSCCPLIRLESISLPPLIAILVVGPSYSKGSGSRASGTPKTTARSHAPLSPSNLSRTPTRRIHHPARDGQICCTTRTGQEWPLALGESLASSGAASQRTRRSASRACRARDGVGQQLSDPQRRFHYVRYNSAARQGRRGDWQCAPNVIS